MNKIIIFLKVVTNAIWQFIKWELWNYRFKRIFFNCKDEVYISIRVKRKYRFYKCGMSIFNYKSIQNIKNKKDAQKWIEKNIYEKLIGNMK